jgi:hypothetical protein
MALVTFLPLEIEVGLLAGLAVAVAGYLQAYSKVDEKGNREKFSLDKFGSTVIIGGVVGAILGYVGSFEGALATLLMDAGIVAIVGSLVKAILRIK